MKIKGQDFSIKGGNILCNDVNINVANLHLESLQDKEKSRHNGFNVSAGSSSVGAGVEYGKNLGSDLDKMTGGKYDLENKLGQVFYNSYIKFKT
ncbi:hemagglutinin repeat-containing protein [Fusobacterium pseudoperiodonticum]|uniref:hemagglutinin repeat-containing protein n=1 Tax=Fusobacterium pseudoperiodonticum TaxID=2663009 RepID=UPI0036F372AF